MDPFAAFALTFGMIAAASHQAAVMDYYVRARHHAPVVVAQPAWEAAPVAYVPVASAPPPAIAAIPPAPPPAPPRRSSADAREFTRHWQDFMQPSVPRAPGR